MFQLLHFLTYTLQPVLVPLCCLAAWSILIGGICTIAVTAREGIATLKRLHQIPCANCEFFTGEYHLKCPIHPFSALTEEAIHCSDYAPKQKTPGSSAEGEMLLLQPTSTSND